MPRRAIPILLLSIAIPALWHLDANPLLYFYDIYVTNFISSDGLGVDDVDVDSRYHRRSFPPGSLKNIMNKTVWITGASSGIGAELALQLASAGVGHLILSGRNRDGLECVARSCREAHDDAVSRGSNGRGGGGRTSVAAEGEDGYGNGGGGGDHGGLLTSIVDFDMSGGMDVLDDAVSTALRETSTPSGGGGIDVLILNAGRYHIGPAYDTDHDIDLENLMKINCISPIRLAHRLMRADDWKYTKKRGHIVIISSLMGRGTSPLNSIYSMTKHALRAYFTALASEERSWLRVDVVLPGAVDTGLWDGAGTTSPLPSSSSSSLPSSGRTIETTIDGGDRGGEGVREKDARGGDDAPIRPLPYADDRSKMSVGRCARLIVSSMIGPHIIFHETWVTNNPGLLWVYIASYMPNTSMLLSHVIAPFRLDIWREKGEDALYLPTIMSRMWASIPDYLVGRLGGLTPS
jgi:short-subunit dehydrogenase